MITIRLQRRGRKNDPSFRVIVVDSHRAAKTGNFLEIVGTYDPRVDRVELKADRIKHWIGNGATLSDTVHNILVNQKVIEGKKKNVLPKKTVPAAPAHVEGKKEDGGAAAAAVVATGAASSAVEEKTEEAPEAPAEAPSAPAEAVADAAPAEAGTGADGGGAGGE